MKNVLGIIILLLMTSCTPKETATWKITPYPNTVITKPGIFSFEDGVKILVEDSSLKPSIELFKNKLEDLGISGPSNAKNTLVVELKSSENNNSEAYSLKIESHKIVLTAQSPSGIFYGLMTLWQGAKLSGNKSVPCGEIADEPRFEYRGFMLDESRHFFGKEKVEQLIDLMSVLKLNTFHWHLTDATGWRIEIKQFPKLTTIGGIGNNTDPNAPARYYTQEEIKQIVAYAEERFITIIPEIDMPGHATAANKAYPEYSGGGSEAHPEFTFNPGKEETYGYLTAILKEVSQLFPSKYIHLGGDEVHFGNENWAKDNDITALMKREKLNSLTEVEHYFMRRMADSIALMDKKIAGWDEVIGSGIPKENLLVYWWRHDKPETLKTSLDGKYDIVLCPRIPLYFDFVQHESHENGRKWDGAYGTIEAVYRYPDSTHTFNKEETRLIKGIQGNLWSERIKTDEWVDFMAFPRMIALSESAWTEKTNKDLDRFQTLLPSWYSYLDEIEVGYYDSFTNTPEIEPEF